MKIQKEPIDAIHALPAFPAVLVTVAKNIISVAAFSFCSFDPPMIMIGIIPENYSYELIKREKSFAVNIPRHDQFEIVKTCGSVSGRTADKYSRAGITPLKAKKISGYIIKECPVNIECSVLSEYNCNGSHIWFIGRIESVQIEEDYKREQALMFWLGQYRKVGEIIHSKS